MEAGLAITQSPGEYSTTLLHWHFRNLGALSMQSDMKNNLTMGLAMALSSFLSTLSLTFITNPRATRSILENVLSAINSLIGLLPYLLTVSTKEIAGTPPMEYPCTTRTSILRTWVRCWYILCTSEMQLLMVAMPVDLAQPRQFHRHTRRPDLRQNFMQVLVRAKDWNITPLGQQNSTHGFSLSATYDQACSLSPWMMAHWTRLPAPASSTKVVQIKTRSQQAKQESMVNSFQENRCQCATSCFWAAASLGSGSWLLML